MRTQLTLIIALFALFLSTQAFAQSSIAESIDSIDLEALLFEDVGVLLHSDFEVARNYGNNRGYNRGNNRNYNRPRGNYNAGRTYTNVQSRQYRGSRTYVAPTRTYQTVSRTTYRTNYRPRVQYVAPAPVVVVQPTPVARTTTVVAEQEPVYVYSEKEVGRYTMGLRVLGLSEADEVFDVPTFGGVGLYVRARPLRFLGVEVASDILYSSIDDIEVFKVPITVGLMGHIFDYGILDVYGIGAVGVVVNSVSYNLGYGYDISDTFVQFTGQIGGGVGLNFSGFELFLDARYTVTESAAKEHRRANNASDESSVSHGVVFMLGLGFSVL